MADELNSAPVTSTGNVWERPWDVGEMRGSAGRWSLAADAGLLLHLQNFSQQLLTKTHDMQKKLNEVDREAKLTGVRMSNALSEFIMLANKQFVENRVYDEDESLNDSTKATNTEQQEKTTEQREADLIPKISEALSQGLSVLDTAYDKLEIRSEHEEGDGTHTRTETLLAPRDPYSNRRLPHLIGTIHFMQDDTLGLVDASEADKEEMMEPEPEAETESESDEEGSDKIPTSHVRTKQHRVPDWSDGNGSESEEDLFATHSKDPREDRSEMYNEYEDRRQEEEYGEEEEEEDMFESEKDQNYRHNAEQRNEQDLEANDNKAPSFLDELANKVKGPQSNQPQENVNRSTKGHKQSQKNNKIAVASGDDLFAEVRGQDVDENGGEDDIFRQTSGRFSAKGGGLFDDDEEEGGLFGHPKKSSEPKQSQPKSKTVPVVASENSSSSITRKQHGKSPGVGKPRGGGLFGGDASEEDEDDIFVSAAKSKTKSKSASDSRSKGGRGGGKGGGLFGEDSASAEDDQDSLFNESVSHSKPAKKDSTNKKKLPPGGVPMFGSGGNPLISSLRKQHEDTPTDESGSDSEDDRRSSQQDTDTSSSTDLRTAIRKPAGQRRPQGIQVLPTPTAANPSTGGLFGDDTSDIFSEAASNSMTKTEKQRPGSGNNKVKVTPDSGLFGAEEDEDLFASKSSQKSNAPKSGPSRGGGGLFGGDDEEDDLFSTASKPAPASNTQESSSKPKKTVLSLFDDDAEEEDDIFAAVASKNTQKETKPAKQNTKKPSSVKSASKSGVFEDEDGLFGGESGSGSGRGEDPDVDLFGASSPLASPVKTTMSKPLIPESAPTQSKVKDTYSSSSSTYSQGGSTNKTSSGPSLFGEDEEEEEDLFSSTDKKKEASRTKLGTNSSSSRPSSGTSSVASSLSKGPSGMKKAPSIFDDDDEEDLFASSSSSSRSGSRPSSGNVKKSIPVPEQKENLPSPVAVSNREATKPVPTDQSSSGSDPLLGSAPLHPGLDPLGSPASEDVSQTKEPDKSAKQSGRVQKQPELARNGQESDSSGWSEDEKDGDKDLFGSTKKSVTKPPVKVAAHVPPAGLPSGAVSLFGGMDPASILGKSKFKGHRASPEEQDEDVSVAQKHSEVRGATAGETPSQSTATVSGISNVGFDQPAVAATLHSATKDRVRIARNRRLPSRRTRNQGAVASGGGIIANGEAASGTSSLVDPESIPHSASPIPAGQDDPDALFQEEPSLSNGFDASSTKRNENGQPRTDVRARKDIPGDGLFGEAKNKHSLFDSEDIFGSSSEKVPRTSQINSGENLFNQQSSNNDENDSQKVQEISESNEDIFGTKTQPKSSSVAVRPKETRNLLSKEDDNYDIFSDNTLVKTKSANKGRPPKDALSQSNTNKSDDLDIFQTSSSSSSTASHSKPKPAPAAASVFDDAEDDLFGSATSTKTKTKSNKSIANKSDDFDIFGSTKDDEDIFSSSASSNISKSSSKSKESKSKVSSGHKSKAMEDIFGDDTDIFADAPKARSQKVKKNTASLFSDDFDDIFANTKTNSKSAKTPATAKTNKSKAPAQNAKAFIDDIFGDDSSASIFDDPLSATKR